MLTTGTLWALTILGILIVFVLLASIRKHAKILKASDQQKKQFEAKEKSQLAGVEESLMVLASSMIDKQVETSEGCYRIKVLLDYFDASLHEDPRFSIFSTMYEGLQHMPTHQARKEVDKRFLFKLDKQRYELEQEHEEAILKASKSLLEYLRDL